MEAECVIPFRGGRARFVQRAQLAAVPAWREAFAAKAKDFRFYEIVDETLTSGFVHHYAVLEDQTGTVRAVQPVFFVRQNLVEGVPALRVPTDFIRRWWPRFLTMRLLMVGNPAGDGHLGNIQPDDEEWVARALGEVLAVFARQNKVALIVWKDFPCGYRKALRPLLDADFTRVPSMPMTRLALRFRDFEDYLGTLSKATRKDLRRKFRKAEKAPPLTLEVLQDISPLVDEVFPLYLQVHERSTMKFETLTKDYLRELGRRLPGRACFFVWRSGDRIVAFSIALIYNGTIYDDYLGLDYAVALDLHLYFLTFRDVLSWSIAQGLTQYLSSPLNYEPKLHLGCELLPLDLYVQHTRPWLNLLFSHLLPLLEPTRHDPVLHRFKNADEL